MPILQELSTAVKRQRSEMGLSQERLAELAGLSRATINKLETGKLANLSLLRAERLTNLLGFGLGVIGLPRPKGPRGSDNALDTAVRTANVSYGAELRTETLRHALLTGVIPPNHIPHVRALLDEAPVSVLSAVVAQLEEENGARRKTTWQKMRQLAAAVACTRGIWS